MLHVALRYRGCRRIGAFLTEEAHARIAALRAAGGTGRVAALDGGGRPIVVRVEHLAEDPVVYGTGADPTPLGRSA